MCGIVNVTPDSFFDGGRRHDPAGAVEHAHALIAEGADFLDVGGESTRPGIASAFRRRGDRARRPRHRRAWFRATSVPISVDTSRPEVMREAVAAGAVMINDVRALRMARRTRRRGRPRGAGVSDAHAGRAAHHANGAGL